MCTGRIIKSTIRSDLNGAYQMIRKLKEFYAYREMIFSLEKRDLAGTEEVEMENIV